MALAAMPPKLALANGKVTVRVGYFDKYWPLSRRDEDGVMRGLLIDALNLLGRDAAIEFEHQGYPWARTQALIERGDLDAFCTVPTKERLAYAEFCATPVVVLDYGVWHRADDPRPGRARSVEDFRALRQGHYRGSGYAREFLEFDRLAIDNDEESVLRKIGLGTLDCFVIGELVSANKVADLGLRGKLRYTPLPWLPKGEFRFGLRSNYPEASRLVERMEAVTRAAKARGALQALLERYRALAQGQD